jgi:hypothetical protein
VTRHVSRIAIVASLLVAIAVTTGLVVSDAGAATTLRGRLHIAQRELKKASHRLDAAQAALEAALSADATVTAPAPTPVALTATAPAAPAVSTLQAKVDKARSEVRVWKKKVRALAAKVHQEEQIAAWERDRDWMPIIKIAAARYHVKADGMYRMMMRESGGNPRAGACSAFKGLYQYWTGTWANTWNPWRHESIYDGSSQIFATAYAISRGMGRQMWTTTFASRY